MNKLRLLIFYFFLIGITSVVNGQTKAQIDSVEHLLEIETQPLEQANFLILLAVAYRHHEIQKAINYAHRAIQLTPKEEPQKLARAYSTLGGLYGHKNVLNEAILYLDSAIFLYQQLGNDKELARAYGNLGSMYTIATNYEKALEIIQKSLIINEKIGYGEGIAGNLNAMVSINLIQKEYKNGLINGKRALALYERPYDKTVATMNLGVIYFEMENIDSAYYYFNQALEICQQTQNKGQKAFVYQYLGLIYKKQKKYPDAIEYLSKAIELEEYIASESYKLGIQNNLAAAYFDIQEYQKSIFYYEKTQKTAHHLELIQYKKDALEGLAKNFAALNKFDKAYTTILEFVVLKDSILDESKQNSIKELEIKYDSYKKEQANILLAKDRDLQKLNAERSRQLNYGIVLVLILVLIVSYLLLRQYKLRSVQQTLELKHRLLRNQMNPHFIFNSLVAIQSFVYKNEPREAGKFLSSFAKLVRAILENSREEYISLAKEIQWLENYLKLQLLRFDNKFEYHIELDENIDIDSTVIPPMLTQPFIENALEHGLKNIDYLGQLTVSFKLLEDELQIEVQDNGIGINAPTEDKEKSNHVSLATNITKERLDFLNQNRQKKINFRIINIEPQGTLVSFVIPLKKTTK